MDRSYFSLWMETQRLLRPIYFINSGLWIYCLGPSHKIGIASFLDFWGP